MVTRKVSVILKTEERVPGACRPRKIRDTFALHIQMVDDDGDVILEETRTGLTCDRRIRLQKFLATYDVNNCAGSTAPSRVSKGEITVNVTTDDGELAATRKLSCRE
jgi:hypothetical protein